MVEYSAPVLAVYTAPRPVNEHVTNDRECGMGTCDQVRATNTGSDNPCASEEDDEWRHRETFGCEQRDTLHSFSSL